MSKIAGEVLSVRPVAATFVAEFRGMQVSGDVPDAQFAQFVDLLHRYRVLVLPSPGLDPADLVAFSRRLGPLEIHSNVGNTLPGHREIFCVGNVERGGMKASFTRGVEQWHADSSFREVPSDASLFYGEVVPAEGGETMFADATASYAALDAAMQRRLEGLRAVHSLETLYEWNLQFNPGRGPYCDEMRQAWPPVSQQLVRVHPVTRQKSLYLCPAVISHIEGMDKDDGRALIEQFITHVTQPCYVYSHRWRQGDLVVWDNRAVLHTASLFDHDRFQRLMYRTTVAGNSLRAT